MKYNNVEFEAVVATPGCGKSYLCDKYPQLFIDVDEVRLRCKYIVPEDITREELEATKGARPFPRRAKREQYIKDLYVKLDEYRGKEMTLIAAPHLEAIDYFVMNNIKFCFVFPGKDMKEETIRRMELRGNPPETVKENADMFDSFYQMNKSENKSALHYEFSKGEYLEDIIKKFGFNF